MLNVEVFRHLMLNVCLRPSGLQTVFYAIGISSQLQTLNSNKEIRNQVTRAFPSCALHVLTHFCCLKTRSQQDRSLLCCTFDSRATLVICNQHNPCEVTQIICLVASNLYTATRSWELQLYFKIKSREGLSLKYEDLLLKNKTKPSNLKFFLISYDLIKRIWWETWKTSRYTLKSETKNHEEFVKAHWQLQKSALCSTETTRNQHATREKHLPLVLQCLPAMFLCSQLCKSNHKAWRLP